MPRIKQNRILFVDLELTCWEGEPPSGESPEIIRIAVVEKRTDKIPREGRSTDLMVRPVRSHVSEYCTQLTGITPEDARRGRPFTEVCAGLRRDFGSVSTTWAAWGDDRTVLEEHCIREKCNMPFAGPYIDVGTLWSLITGASSSTGLISALKQAGMEFEGIPHRPLDDALNAARIFDFMSSSVCGSLENRTELHIHQTDASGPVFK